MDLCQQWFENIINEKMDIIKIKQIHLRFTKQHTPKKKPNKYNKLNPPAVVAVNKSFFFLQRDLVVTNTRKTRVMTLLEIAKGSDQEA